MSMGHAPAIVSGATYPGGNAWHQCRLSRTACLLSGPVNRLHLHLSVASFTHSVSVWPALVGVDLLNAITLVQLSLNHRQRHHPSPVMRSQLQQPWWNCPRAVLELLGLSGYSGGRPGRSPSICANGNGKIPQHVYVCFFVSIVGMLSRYIIISYIHKAFSLSKVILLSNSQVQWTVHQHQTSYEKSSIEWV